MTRERWAALLLLLLAVGALGAAFASEWWGGLVPCALCLWERWPYRVLIGVALVALTVPARLARWLLLLGALVALADVGLGVVHVGVEQGWWPSPLPECAAPSFGGGSFAERLARMPAEPAKPCDDPTFLVTGVPVSMAAMNGLLAFALSAALVAVFARPVPRSP